MVLVMELILILTQTKSTTNAIFNDTVNKPEQEINVVAINGQWHFKSLRPNLLFHEMPAL